MKKIYRQLLLVFIMALSLSSVAVKPVFAESALEKILPEPTKAFFVNDFADQLSENTEVQIQNQAVALYKETKAQVVVVTVPSLQGYTLEEYSNALFNKWGIGDAKLDNGVLMLLAQDERQMRIEVGSGLEGALNDGKTGRIQDEYMISHFKNNDFDTGMIGGFTKITEIIYEEYSLSIPSDVNSSDYYQPNKVNSGNDSELNPIFVILIVILIFLDVIFNRGRITRVLLYAMSRGGGRGGGGGGGGGFGGGGGSSSGGGSSRSF